MPICQGCGASFADFRKFCPHCKRLAPILTKIENNQTDTKGVNMAICAGCGFSFNDTFQFCPQCGRAKPKPAEPAKLNVSVSVSLSGTECPLCHKDDKVEKVSAIVQRDTHRISGSVPVTSTYSDSDGRIRTTSGSESFSGTQVSHLAELLTPPSKPEHGFFSFYRKDYIFGPLLVYVAIILPISLAGLIGSFSDPRGINVYLSSLDRGRLALLLLVDIGTILFNICYLAFFIWLRKKGASVLKPKIERWNRAMERWFKLYYCYRDGCVYIPTENTSAPISNMVNYIYID